MKNYHQVLYTIRKISIISMILWSVIPSYASSRQIVGYPSVTQREIFTPLGTSSFLEGERLVSFLAQWDSFEHEVPFIEQYIHSMLYGRGSQPLTIQQMESLYTIQSIQYEQILQNRFPTLSISTNPQVPLYSYNQATQTHRFGGIVGVSQSLPTAGNLELSLRHGITYVDTVGWSQSPSVVLSFQQPLKIGERIIDFSYADKMLQKQQLSKNSASEALRVTHEQLFLQSGRFLNVRQSLLESRYILSQRALVQKARLDDALSDLEKGRISRNRVLMMQNGYNRVVSQIDTLDREIRAIEHSLENLGNFPSSFPEAIAISYDTIMKLWQLQQELFTDYATVVESLLPFDATYKDAQREYQKATLDRAIGNPSDAPRLSIALELSPPFPSPPPANTFSDSITQLFSSGQPNLSVTLLFIAPDLFRRTSNTTGAIIDETVSIALGRMVEARQSLEVKVEDIHRRILSSFSEVSLEMDAYDLAYNDLEVEHIRVSMGLSSEELVREKELDVYQAAFTVLQRLRELSLLSFELNFLLGNSVETTQNM